METWEAAEQPGSILFIERRSDDLPFKIWCLCEDETKININNIKPWKQINKDDKNETSLLGFCDNLTRWSPVDTW